jgi:hypothetical protein
MNRRRFFTSLGLIAGAASVSPQIFIPKFESVRWKSFVFNQRGFQSPDSGWLTQDFLDHRITTTIQEGTWYWVQDGDEKSMILTPVNSWRNRDLVS